MPALHSVKMYPLYDADFSFRMWSLHTYLHLLV